MKVIIGIIVLAVISSITIKILKRQRQQLVKSSTIKRFKRKFIGRNYIKERMADNFSNSLMNDPEKNIKINNWDNEENLREKADIHRTRLNKYGRSKMNGEMLFMGPKGGVYKKNSKGEKKYV